MFSPRWSFSKPQTFTYSHLQKSFHLKYYRCISLILEDVSRKRYKRNISMKMRRILAILNFPLPQYFNITGVSLISLEHRMETCDTKYPIMMNLNFPVKKCYRDFHIYLNVLCIFNIDPFKFSNSTMNWVKTYCSLKIKHLFLWLNVYFSSFLYSVRSRFFFFFFVDF